MVAHVVGGSTAPPVLQWAAALALFAGAVAAFAVRRSLWRRVALASALAGLLGTLLMWVVAAGPGPPPYALRIVSPSGSTPSRALFTVCGVLGDGTQRPAADSQHYLVPFVDGRQAPTVDVSQVPLTLSGGAHTVRFDLVTTANQEYVPPVSAVTQVVVSPSAPAAAPRPC